MNSWWFKIIEIIVGIGMGWLYFIYAFTIGPSKLTNFYLTLTNIQSLALYLSIPLVACIASFAFRYIRWGLLSFSLTCLTLFVLLQYSRFTF